MGLFDKNCRLFDIVGQNGNLVAIPYLIAVAFGFSACITTDSEMSKEQYFAQACFTYLKKDLNQENFFLSGSVKELSFKSQYSYSVVKSYNAMKNSNSTRREEQMYCTMFKGKCDSSYEQTVWYTKIKPWGENEQGRYTCYFSGDGNVLAGD